MLTTYKTLLRMKVTFARTAMHDVISEYKYQTGAFVMIVIHLFQN